MMPAPIRYFNTDHCRKVLSVAVVAASVACFGTMFVPHHVWHPADPDRGDWVIESHLGTIEILNATEEEAIITGFDLLGENITVTRR